MVPLHGWPRPHSRRTLYELSAATIYSAAAAALKQCCGRLQSVHRLHTTAVGTRLYLKCMYYYGRHSPPADNMLLSCVSQYCEARSTYLVNNIFLRLHIGERPDTFIGVADMFDRISR